MLESLQSRQVSGSQCYIQTIQGALPTGCTLLHLSLMELGRNCDTVSLTPNGQFNLQGQWEWEETRMIARIRPRVLVLWDGNECLSFNLRQSRPRPSRRILNCWDTSISHMDTTEVWESGVYAYDTLQSHEDLASLQKIAENFDWDKQSNSCKSLQQHELLLALTGRPSEGEIVLPPGLFMAGWLAILYQRLRAQAMMRK